MFLRRSNPASSAAIAERPTTSALSPTTLFLTASALALSVLAAQKARALPVERELFTWAGRVDREVFITVRGRDVSTRGENTFGGNRTRVNDALPRTTGLVVVRLNNGRGDVDVIEQPSARNGYQAVIRIRDPRGGADSYRLTAYWEGNDRNDDRYGDRNDGRYDGRNDGRNDGRYDNRGDRRDDRDRNGGYDDRYPNGGYGDRGNGNYGDRGNNGSESGTLRWSGRVDDVVEIRISGRRVDAITRSGAAVQNVSANISGSGLPQRNVTLQVDQLAGRGSIEVVQQPSSRNGYTAVIRINDPRGGAAPYDFTARW